ncbi:MAG: isocitrate lyase/phosphoenolpyruvate mutase family protein [Bacteroidota bacterium]
MTFKELHYQQKPLILFNIWDVPSVKLAENLGFEAVGTSSSAIASMLGYQDGEKMTFSELEYIVKRITTNTQLPVSVDIEAGYSRDPEEILGNVKRLAKTGVKGINIEDSIVTDSRTMTDSETFSEIIKLLKDYLHRNGVELFLNVRTDAFILSMSNAVEETQNRVSRYESAGADGIFTPGIVSETEIVEIVNCTELPVNVMCMPNLPDFDQLASIGVKRISMGNFLFEEMPSKLKEITQQLITDKSFKSLF